MKPRTQALGNGTAIGGGIASLIIAAIIGTPFGKLFPTPQSETPIDFHKSIITLVIVGVVLLIVGIVPEAVQRAKERKGKPEA
jgi:hypothetical protein